MLALSALGLDDFGGAGRAGGRAVKTPGGDIACVFCSSVGRLWGGGWRGMRAVETPVVVLMDVFIFFAFGRGEHGDVGE